MLSYHFKLARLARNWLDANVSCLIKANRLPSMLFCLEILPIVLH